MREATINDMIILAEKIAGLPAEDMRHAAEAYIRNAHYADSYRKRTGKSHAGFGNGTLTSAVFSDGGYAPHRRASDPAFLRAFSTVCNLIAERAERHADAA